MDLNFEVANVKLHLCHPNGRFVTALEASLPGYIPCIRFSVKRPVKQPKRLRSGAISRGHIYSPYLPVYKAPVVTPGSFPALNISTSVAKKSKTRKLKTKWSVEAAQDLRALYKKTKKKIWTLVYNHGNGQLYDFRRDKQLVKLKIKKRNLKPFLNRILNKKFEIYKTLFDEYGFTKFVKPLIRKASPALISQNLVSVQPMTAPTNLIFHKPKIINPKMYGTVTVSNL